MVAKYTKFSWFQFFKKYRLDFHQLWLTKKRIYKFPRPFKYRNIEKNLRVRFNLRIDVRNPKPKRKRRTVFFKQTRLVYYLFHYYRTIRLKTLKNHYRKLSIGGSYSNFIRYGSFLKNYTRTVNSFQAYNSGRIRAFLSKLELRLDSVLIRLGFFNSPLKVKRFINSGFILVNNKVCVNPAYHLKPFDQLRFNFVKVASDQTSAYTFFKALASFKKRIRRRLIKPISPYFIFNFKTLTLLILKSPQTFDITYPFRINLHRLSTSLGRIRVLF
jgi:ribosomal protein S4